MNCENANYEISIELYSALVINIEQGIQSI